MKKKKKSHKKEYPNFAGQGKSQDDHQAQADWGGGTGPTTL